MTPHFTLVTNDGGEPKVYHDSVLPDVQSKIAAREGIKVWSTARATRKVPALAGKAEDQEVIEGVVLFRNVDPKTDFFTIYMTGFSNAYRMARGPEGKLVLERKTIVQKFKRPGDAFYQEEKEFDFIGKPSWIYRPESWSLNWPKTITTAPEKILVTRPDATPKEVLNEAGIPVEEAGNGGGN